MEVDFEKQKYSFRVSGKWNHEFVSRSCKPIFDSTSE